MSWLKKCLKGKHKWSAHYSSHRKLFICSMFMICLVGAFDYHKNWNSVENWFSSIYIDIYVVYLKNKLLYWHRYTMNGWNINILECVYFDAFLLFVIYHFWSFSCFTRFCTTINGCIYVQFIILSLISRPPISACIGKFEIQEKHETFMSIKCPISHAIRNFSGCGFSFLVLCPLHNNHLGNRTIIALHATRVCAIKSMRMYVNVIER